MKKSYVMKLSSSALAFLMVGVAHAAGPLWTFNPLTDTKFPILVGNTQTVKYLVTNQSKRRHTLVMTPIPGITQTTTGNNCSNPFMLDYLQSCILTLTVNGSLLSGPVTSGPLVCEQSNPSQCYQPSFPHILNITPVTNGTSLTASLSTLALKTSGLARQITITNPGSEVATGLLINYPVWPTGTSAVSTCGDTLAAGASCTITIVPGPTATSGTGNAACTTGIAPIPGVVSVTSSNATQASVDVVVLGYGCIYQGGYIYAMTDTTDTSQSIGGTVTSLSDQAVRYPDGIIWSSNGDTGHGSGGFDADDVSNDLLPGVDVASTPSAPSPTFSAFQTFFATTYTNPNPFTSSSFSACQGNTDGPCNTRNIVTFYNQFITNYDAVGGITPFTATPGPTPAYYAAGLCQQTINGYSEWYLPAICEMGPTTSTAGCAPGTQNILDNLPGLIGDPCAFGANCLAGLYWSSTEDSTFQQDNAWAENFFLPVGAQTTGVKYFMLGVRCSRAF